MCLVLIYQCSVYTHAHKHTERVQCNVINADLFYFTAAVTIHLF